MARFIIATFALLGWAFYEMSGGADFEPRSARMAESAPMPASEAEGTASAAATSPAIALDTNVTRVSLNLTTVEDVLTGGTTQPSRIVSPLPDSGARSEPPSEDIAAAPTILPSLVQRAGETTVQTVSTGFDALRDAPAAQPVLAPAADIRRVSGSRVNVRGGPGTGFDVVFGLVQGEAVEVLEDDGIGWVRMRPVGGGPEGWIAARLLEDG